MAVDGADGDDGHDDGEQPAPEASATVSAAAPAEVPPTPPADGHRPLATPATRALARRLGVDLRTVSGTGPGGRIVDADVTAAGSTAAPAVVEAPPPGPAGVERGAAPAGSRITLRGVRKRTAETMTAAWQAVPHVDSFHEIDVTELFALR